VKFVGRNTGPSIESYMAEWKPRQREEVVNAIAKLLDEDFPEMEVFYMPMVANIVVGSKN
jgi:hypothetical protein